MYLSKSIFFLKFMFQNVFWFVYVLVFNMILYTPDGPYVAYLDLQGWTSSFLKFFLMNFKLVFFILVIMTQ